jgi:hypothetical protein
MPKSGMSLDSTNRIQVLSSQSGDQGTSWYVWYILLIHIHQITSQLCVDIASISAL